MELGTGTLLGMETVTLSVLTFVFSACFLYSLIYLYISAFCDLNISAVMAGKVTLVPALHDLSVEAPTLWL